MRVFGGAVSGVVVWFALAGVVGADDAVKRAEREKRFEESFRRVALVGHFTDSNKKSGQLTEDKYIIEKVAKDQGDDWAFTVRIQYGAVDLPVTLKIPVVWAGDTPVITVQDLQVPVLGKFNGRIVVHGDYYAGTWGGAGHHGHLFGRIEKLPAEKPAEKKPADKKPSEKKPTEKSPPAEKPAAK